MDWDDMDSAYWTARCQNCNGTRGFDHEYKQNRCLTVRNAHRLVTYTVFEEGRNMNNIDNEFTLAQYQRKADQAYEMAGLARTDGDLRDEQRHLAAAKAYDQRIKEYLEGAAQ